MAMIIDRWKIVDFDGVTVGYKVIRHKTGRLYEKLEPFQQYLKENMLTACLVSRKNMYTGFTEYPRFRM